MPAQRATLSTRHGGVPNDRGHGSGPTAERVVATCSTRCRATQRSSRVWAGSPARLHVEHLGRHVRRYRLAGRDPQRDERIGHHRHDAQARGAARGLVNLRRVGGAPLHLPDASRLQRRPHHRAGRCRQRVPARREASDRGDGRARGGCALNDVAVDADLGRSPSRVPCGQQDWRSRGAGPRPRANTVSSARSPRCARPDAVATAAGDVHQRRPPTASASRAAIAVTFQPGVKSACPQSRAGSCARREPRQSR